MKKTSLLTLLLGFTLSLSAQAAGKTDIPVYTEQKTTITVSASQPEFSIQLKSNPSTGYSWFLREYHTRYVQAETHRFQAPDNPKLIGAPGYEVWTFKLKPEAFRVPLRTSLRFVYARPWEKGGETPPLVFWISTVEKK